jgi:molybdopterin-guanine dinucleotide biosynthesis protein
MADDKRHTSPAPRIVVVGTCASGKTTLVEALRAFGYDASVSAQEHSAVPRLWQRSDPDVLIALVANIDAVRERRDASWPGWLHDVQEERLASAQDAADLVIDTSELEPGEVADRAIEFLSSRDSA